MQFKKRTLGDRLKNYFKHHGASFSIHLGTSLAAISAGVLVSALLTPIMGPLAIAPLTAVSAGIVVAGTTAAIKMRKWETETKQKDQIEKGNREGYQQEYLIVPGNDGKKSRFGAATNQAHLDARCAYLENVNKLNGMLSKETDQDKIEILQGAIKKLNEEMRSIEIHFGGSSKKATKYDDHTSRISGIVNDASKQLDAASKQAASTPAPQAASPTPPSPAGSTALVGKAMRGVTPPQQATPPQPPSPQLKSSDTVVNVLFNLKQEHGDSRSPTHAAMRQGYAERRVELEKLAKSSTDSGPINLIKEMGKIMDNLEKNIKQGDVAAVQIARDELKQCYQKVDSLIQAKESSQAAHTPSAPRI